MWLGSTGFSGQPPEWLRGSEADHIPVQFEPGNTGLANSDTERCLKTLRLRYLDSPVLENFVDNADLKPSLQCQKAVKRVLCALGQPKIIGSGRPNILLPLVKTFVKPHWECCVQGRRPYLVWERKMLEQIRRVFTCWFGL